MNIIEKKIYDRIKNYVETNYKKISENMLTLGDLTFNNRCHLNSVQKIKENKATKVFSCVAINKNEEDIIVHFINQLEDGMFQDNTWGWIYDEYDYYIVKEIIPEEYEKIGKQLEELKEFLINSNSNIFERFFGKINSNNFI